MGNVVHIENVLNPTCGEMFNRFRNVFNEADYREVGFYYEGTLVARIITADIQLNGEMITGVRIIEKRPVYSISGEAVGLFGVNNGIAIIQNTLIGLACVDGDWIAKRELDDPELLVMASTYLQ